jgi:hypothetical protein
LNSPEQRLGSCTYRVVEIRLLIAGSWLLNEEGGRGLDVVAMTTFVYQLCRCHRSPSSEEDNAWHLFEGKSSLVLRCKFAQFSFDGVQWWSTCVLMHESNCAKLSILERSKDTQKTVRAYEYVGVMRRHEAWVNKKIVDKLRLSAKMGMASPSWQFTELSELNDDAKCSDQKFAPTRPRVTATQHHTNHATSPQHNALGCILHHHSILPAAAIKNNKPPAPAI